MNHRGIEILPDCKRKVVFADSTTTIVPHHRGRGSSDPGVGEYSFIRGRGKSRGRVQSIRLPISAKNVQIELRPIKLRM